MGGICGIAISEQGFRVDKSYLKNMINRLEWPSDMNYGGEFAKDNFAIAVRGEEECLGGLSTLKLNGCHIALAIYGKIYNLSDVVKIRDSEGKYFDRLMNIYIDEGVSFVKRLRGDFVIAIWDGRKQSMTLATDRFRVHPLFYYADNGKIIFSSRMKGILDCTIPLKLTVDPRSVVDAVGMSVIPTPNTIFKEVKKIPARSILIYKDRNLDIQPYWNATFINKRQESINVLIQEFINKFDESISMRLQGYNSSNIGAFLSGGVDSSTITGILSKKLGPNIKAFSIGFDEQPYNEIEYAEIAANLYEAEHYKYFVSANDTFEVIKLIADSFDEPYCNASAVSVYYCAKLAKDAGVKVLFAGDGGDELFAGNTRYATQVLFEYYHKIPAILRKLFEPAYFNVADHFKWLQLIKGKKYINRANIPYHHRVNSWNIYNIMPINELFQENVIIAIGNDYNPDEIFNYHFFKAAADNNLDRHLYADWHLTLADNDLIKFRMAEVVGVQIRFPYLDHLLAEFSATVPAHIKMPGRKLRAFQKQAFADLLPIEIRNKKKHGFGLPVSVWIKENQDLREAMYELLLSNKTLNRGFYRKEGIEKVVKNYFNDDTSFFGTLIWHLMIVELWLRTWADNNQTL